jgi:putative addiction module component (TIGR02574 family)
LDFWHTLEIRNLASLEILEQMRYHNPMTALLENIRHLSVAERLQLLEDIWDGILEDEAVPPLSEAQRAEIDRRLEAYDANPDSGRPWSEVRERLMKR